VVNFSVTGLPSQSIKSTKTVLSSVGSSLSTALSKSVCEMLKFRKKQGQPVTVGVAVKVGVGVGVGHVFSAVHGAHLIAPL